jgi:hypothetical protein
MSTSSSGMALRPDKPRSKITIPEMSVTMPHRR